MNEILFSSSLPWTRNCDACAVATVDNERLFNIQWSCNFKLKLLFIFTPELFYCSETTLWLYYAGAGARFNDFRYRAPSFSTTHPVKTSISNKSEAINFVVFLFNCDKSHKEWKMIMHFYFIVFLRLKVAFSHLFKLELNVLLIQTVCFLLFIVKPLKWFRSMRNKLTWALHTAWNNVKDVWK